MTRICAPTKLSSATLVGLFVSYTAALMAVSSVDMTPHKVQLFTQLTNVSSLAVLLVTVAAFNRAHKCNGRWTWSWVTFGVLAANLAARAAVAATRTEQQNMQAKYTRWDTAAAVVGVLAVLAEMYYAIVPKQRLRTTFFGLGLVFVLPLISAVPSLFQGTRPDPLVAKGALLASQQAYASFDGKDNSTRVVAIVDGGKAFLAFAGTETSADARIDVTVGDVQVPPDWLQPNDPKVRAHRGFVKLYTEIRPKVLRLAAQHQHLEIVCCGHSLGGALATLAALDLASRAVLPMHMYSIGAPQVGDAALVQLFNARVPYAVRIVNPFDPVPRSLSTQFVHTKGYYAVTSLSQDTPLTAHNLSAYKVALERPTWLRVTGVFAPLAYVALAVALVVLTKYAWQRGWLPA